MPTKIEWTEESWNPIRARRKSDGKQGHYCQRISPGCKNCYAASMNRWRGNGVDYTVPGLEEVELYLDESALLQPLRWKKPRSIFVCSMTDLFGDFVPDEWIERIYAVMALASTHTFMVLTKRPARRLLWYRGITAGGNRDCEEMRDAMVEGWAQYIYSKLHPEERKVEFWLAVNLPLKNVREGLSVCTQKEADDLIPILCETPAALRWLSMEPLLEQVSIEGKPLVDWVVIGGESGHSARECNIKWLFSIVEQCRVAKVPCFVKQLGTNGVDILGKMRGAMYSDYKGGNIDEWPHSLRIRQFPEVR